MADWKSDKVRSDRFIPEIKRILGERLISEGNWQQDAVEGTDLLVFELRPVRVACRIRDYQYLAKYSDEFTIRSGRPSGNDTEMAKIMSGWGDYFFYGFANEDGDALTKWFIGDLKIFRLCLWRDKSLLEDRYKRKNSDGSSFFYGWKIIHFPDFIIHSGEQVEQPF